MNAYVIDVNVLFSGLISRKPFYERLFGQYQFSTPDFALIELEKYRSVFLKKVKGNPADFEEFALLLFSRLTIIPDFLIRPEFKNQAAILCDPVDPKDSLYVALAMQFS
ncbi:MAG: DNA-binding protein [Spirosoma sp.]|nr:DNA-binding protein [Spirosoma sp.]